MDTDSGAAETPSRWCDLHRGPSPTVHLVAIDIRASGAGLPDRYACDDCCDRRGLPSLDELTHDELWQWALTGVVRRSGASRAAA